MRRAVVREPLHARTGADRRERVASPTAPANRRHCAARAHHAEQAVALGPQREPRVLEPHRDAEPAAVPSMIDTSIGRSPPGFSISRPVELELRLPRREPRHSAPSTGGSAAIGSTGTRDGAAGSRGCGDARRGRDGHASALRSTARDERTRARRFTARLSTMRGLGARVPARRLRRIRPRFFMYIEAARHGVSMYTIAHSSPRRPPSRRLGLERHADHVAVGRGRRGRSPPAPRVPPRATSRSHVRSRSHT